MGSPTFFTDKYDPKKKRLVAIAIITVLALIFGYQVAKFLFPEYVFSDKFDSEVWIDNSDLTDGNNPRFYMTDDLIKNHLKPGMHRDSILLLLGQPYKEEIGDRIPTGLEVPDSIPNLHEWYRINSQPDTVMMYPIGWTIVDPLFFVVKLKPDSTAYDFIIEQG